MRRIGAIALCCLAAGLLAGCEKEELGYYEVNRVDELLTERNVNAVLRVLSAVPEGERGALPMPFLPVPNWPEIRTLPVRELVEEERHAYERAWSPHDTAGYLPTTPAWERALAARKLTREQFCGFVLAIGAAAARGEADPDLRLQDLAVRGERAAAPLVADERPFASLPAEERYAVLRRAVWLATTDRAARLALVPEENVSLVAKHREALAKLLPAEFFRDPFEGLYPRQEDYGIPFDEGDLSDADLTWSPEKAVIGTDPPDDRTANATR
jgi:hypothetical protein